MYESLETGGSENWGGGVVIQFAGGQKADLQFSTQPDGISNWP